MRIKGSTKLILALVALLLAVLVLIPPHLKVSALGIVSGLLGFAGSGVAIHESQVGQRYSTLALILASGAFFFLLASVLVQEAQRPPAG